MRSIRRDDFTGMPVAMTPRVADLIKWMEQVAPPHLAESWDNPGLQIGDPDWPVRRVWFALDPLPQVLEGAARQQVDLIITHHPLLIKPLSRIDLTTPAGRVINTALNHHVAVYAAHTNLDAVQGGVNDVLADQIGMTGRQPMLPTDPTGEETNGRSDIPADGIGRTGRLPAAVSLIELARTIKARLGLSRLSTVGADDMPVQHLAICSGSGGGLVDVFLAGAAQVFISGDLKYHDARRIEDAGRALIDIGHFASEQLVLAPLSDKLKQAAVNAEWEISVAACPLEQDPFKSV